MLKSDLKKLLYVGLNFFECCELIINPLSHIAPQYTLLIFFTCLTPDDFTHLNGVQALQLNGLINK